MVERSSEEERKDAAVRKGRGVRIGSAHEFTGGFAPVFCK